MWWCRCKGKTYHEIDGTIYNLGDLRHTARKRTEDLHTRKSKLNPKPRGCLSLYGRPGNSDGGLVTSGVAAIGIMVVCNQFVKRVDVYQASVAACSVVYHNGLPHSAKRWMCRRKRAGYKSAPVALKIWGSGDWTGPGTTRC
jgi:hypothetical protein